MYFLLHFTTVHTNKVHCVYCFGQNPGAREEHLAIQFLWAITRLLVTSVSPIYLVDEFHFLFLLFLSLTPTQQRAVWSGVRCSGYNSRFSVRGIPVRNLWIANFRLSFYEICIQNQWCHKTLRT